jgi:alpha-galactosidase
MHSTAPYRLLLGFLVVLSFAFAKAQSTAANTPALAKIENALLVVEANRPGDTYTLRSKDNPRVAITARVAAQINHHWISSSNYPHHEVQQTSFTGDFGSKDMQGPQLTVTHRGRPGDPDLICLIRLHSQPAFAEIEVQVSNGTAAPTTVQSIRVLEAVNPVVNLDGPPSSDRVLSDSFSEDRPEMEIHDLLQASDGLHLAVGSQLIYNRNSRQSLFLGALTSEHWLTVMHLHVDQKQGGFTGYEVDSTGTTELAKQNSLKNSPKEDQIELSLPVESGKTLASEHVAASFSSDYHDQLECYGNVIRTLHRARVTAPTPIGWWSWTAYYFGITEGTALTNAEFLAQRLKDFGYNFFHIDEGYQFARGDYTSPVDYKFPHGMKKLEYQIRGLGLTPGIWTAPFEIAERSSVFTDHKDWLVHNAQGQPIHAGLVTEAPDTAKDLDPLYILDTTNPGAQQYLRDTYATLTKDWGIRYIKLDFMDDSAIEGNYYRPNTTALEAQRIGLQTIREAVGDGVLLDKDGSVMLNPVGIVDIGRISCDTGHSFESSRTAAPGIAARYYMNRNFFLADPDAFTVSRQVLPESHRAQRPLTLDEAKVSIALAAVSGGLYEIGDDLPTLFGDADRMALVENRDLLNMARYGQAAKPVDLMSYAPEDEMPSIFLLRESKRQSILVVFNWTEKERAHEFSLSDFGLVTSHNQAVDVFAPGLPIAENISSLSLKLAPQSVRIVKILDTSIPAAAPVAKVEMPEKIEAGKPATFSAQGSPGPDYVPALAYHWDFGDGTSVEGFSVTHTYTHAATYTVRLTVEGIEGLPFEKDFPVAVTGDVDTVFRPELYQRYHEKP